MIMKHKIVLVQPEAKSSASLGIRKEPASIMHLAGQLKHEGFDVSMRHAQVDDDLVRWVRETGASVVGISTMTSNFREGEKLAKMLKEIDPKLTIILGGWHASGCAIAHSLGQESESIAEILGPKTPFDYMIAGEGELALPELLRRLQSKADLSDAPGLGRFVGGRIILNPPAIVRDLDSVADPITDGLDISSYRDMRSGALDLSIHFQRGCPWGCGFCATQTVSGKALRSLSIDRVIEQLVHIAETYHPQVITFTNEDPLLDLDYFRTLVRKLNEMGFSKKYGISIDIFASVVDIYRIMTNSKYEGMMEEMKQAGISSFTIGVESFSPHILRKYNRVSMIRALMDPEERREFDSLDERREYLKRDISLMTVYALRVASVISYAYKHGIPCVGDYMVGNPGESMDDIMQSFDLFSRFPHLLMAYIPRFTPYPGTKIWKECYPNIVRGEDGRIAWEKFDASQPTFKSDLDEDIRDRLEVGFYKSRRYFDDMVNAIQAGVLPVKYFRGRFKYLLDKFGYMPDTIGLHMVFDLLDALER